MDLTDLNQLKSLLSRFRIRPIHFLGQNFLISRRVLAQIIQAADLSSDDEILEIGPGVGTLTLALAKKSGGVVACEKDKKFLKVLKFVLRNFPKVKIIHSDILTVDLPKLFPAPRKYKVVANIPYYLTGKLLQILLSLNNKPQRIILLIQKEVAERITARPGQMSLLSLSVQFYGEPGIVSWVSKDSFYPAPEVDSAILKIEVFQDRRFEVDEKDFFRLLKIGFSSPRKTLLNNLSAGLNLPKSEIEQGLLEAGIKPIQRAQELSLKEWWGLSKIFKFPKK